MNQLLQKLIKWFGIQVLKDTFMMLVDQQLTLEILLVINKKPKGLVLQNNVYGQNLVKI